jgi:hypothetical protein
MTFDTGNIPRQGVVDFSIVAAPSTTGGMDILKQGVVDFSSVAAPSTAGGMDILKQGVVDFSSVAAPSTLHNISGSNLLKLLGEVFLRLMAAATGVNIKNKKQKKKIGNVLPEKN